MAFYRHRLTYDEVSPYIQRIRQYLRLNCSVIKEYEEGGPESFLMDVTAVRNAMGSDLSAAFYTLMNTGYIELVPTRDEKSICIIKTTAEGPMTTVTPGFIRLPKLSYLITFTPDDLFRLFKLIHTAKNTQTGNSLMLNPAAAGLESLSQSPLEPFFTKLRTNYRMNTDYCDRKWTNRRTIAALATLEPTRDNQLSALQLLTAEQNDDLLYFPVETMINLELDWQQISDDYCVPKS